MAKKIPSYKVFVWGRGRGVLCGSVYFASDVSYWKNKLLQKSETTTGSKRKAKEHLSVFKKVLSREGQPSR